MNEFEHYIIEYTYILSVIDRLTNRKDLSLREKV